ncbi:hypothetical protein Sta7437_0456 [Stanieria cyanosphaera PCC 7437]|uniref:Uncharacterized protein n=1 Tax=Stanieria cyanosphaera (strain ATCC 29371 / PCC 7437) TaxID=111780 RepID=K9XNA0_STAC7|nr:CRISPR-associated protein Csx18 [Stanieria cyanosphaera]AFZ34065.1 hypothetical protein Sta7437_0456 [Stanieria cyanosphaera PCC 7437]
MYLSTRAAIVRNFATAIVNGAITLILLLIAPLGLAAVISNTFLVTVASFFVSTLSDSMVSWLSASPRHNSFSPSSQDINITYQGKIKNTKNKE